nr:16S rRNA (cytosine(1402)-N(4))-methyltransferase [Saprospiraceae bacterium]
RMEVNDEIGALRDMLEDGLAVLKPGGRFSVITFHSIEDRVVKNFFKSGNFDGEVEKDEFGNIQKPFSLVNKKVIMADAKEQKANVRSRSAKLRVAEKI